MCCGGGTREAKWYLVDRTFEKGCRKEKSRAKAAAHIATNFESG